MNSSLSHMHPAAALQLQQQAMEASINGIVIADMRFPDQPLIYVNPAFERISGYKAEEILGRNCRFLQGTDRDREQNRAARQIMRESLQSGKPCNIVLHNFRKDGTPFWNELHMAPIFDADGVQTHCVGIQHDVTARVEAEIALQLAHDKLEERVAERTQALARAHRALQAKNAELRHAYDTTIEGWSRALDLRDKETEGHCQRVTEITVRLAKALGLSDEECQYARWGALLHDIGKMGIPDSILLKPGRLTDVERKIIEEHPGYAHDLLSPIAFLHPALDIPYYHHEKWDGTGYPCGFAGEEIPLLARLFAVVDVWDALRSDRPYRQAWPEEKVCEHLKSLSGTHFDPRMVELFLRHIPTQVQQEKQSRKEAA